jgi:hypothetical protein
MQASLTACTRSYDAGPTLLGQPMVLTLEPGTCHTNAYIEADRIANVTGSSWRITDFRLTPDLTSLMRCTFRLIPTSDRTDWAFFLCFLEVAFFLKIAKEVVRANTPHLKPTFHLPTRNRLHRLPR